ncbi:MAG TPA: sigma factor, partial [Candidatus Polarisedimenticolia bacterium]|nr:sigma factor [Candidatus Polarisedimenticolia bacterium]
MNRPDWEKELERLHPASFRWALACCSGDREEAREVLQTVYMNLLDGRARFDGDSSPRTWLFAVIRRTASGRRRAGLVRRVLLGRWARRRP